MAEILNQDQMDQRLAQLGGPQLTHAKSVGTTKVRNPNYNDIDFENPQNRQQDTEVTIQRWTSPTGYVLEAYVNPYTGQWEIHRDIPPNPSTSQPARGPQQLANAEADAAQERREKEWNQNTPRNAQNPAAGGSGMWETHAERRKREADEKAAREKADRDNRPEVILREVKNPDGSTRVEEAVMHPGGRVEVRPSRASGSAAPTKNTEIIEVEGRQHEVIRDPTGRILQLRPLTQSNPGPAMPVFIIGQSQAALRSYQAELNAEVAAGRMTPAERDKRWAEAMASARSAIEEQTLIQNDAESRRNTDANLMQNRMNNATTGFANAMQTIEAGNKYLPQGSTLGGQAFRALLKLQQANWQQAGAYSPQYGSTDPAVAPSPTASSLAGAAAGTTAAASSTISNLTSPPATSPRPAMAAPTAPVGSPPPAGAAPAPPAAPPPAAGGAPPSRPFNPLPGEPGHRPGEPVGMAPGSSVAAAAPPEFSVLEKYKPAPVSAPQPSPITAGPEPVAVLHARVRSTPPWQLTEQDYNDFISTGGQADEFWRSPTMAASA